MISKTTFEISNGGIGKHYIKKIENKFIELLNNSPVVQDWFKERGDENVDISLRVVSMSQFIGEDILSMGRITKTAIKNRLSKYIDMESHSTFTMRTKYEHKDGKLYVKGCTLFVRIAPLLNDINVYIRDLEYLWKLYQWLLKHEVGHFIDHILNDNGITSEQHYQQIKETQDNYQKHYEWYDEYSKKPGYSIDTVNRAYYNIPSEARANECIGIDVEEMIAIQNEHNEKFLNKKTTIEINVLKNSCLENKDNKRGDRSE